MIFRRLLSSVFLTTTVLAGALGMVLPASAQVDTGLAQVGSTVKLANTDPRTIITNIINVALGFIGIILVVIILYAGFLYMTSGGDAEKTSKAKKMITSAIIGLVIVLSAWGITRYVISSLLSATQDGGGGVQNGGGGGGFAGGFSGGGGAQGFQVKSISPSGSVPLRNVQVKVVLTRSVDEATVGAITVTKGGTNVAGTVSVQGSVVLFTPSQDCPAPNQAKKCFDADSDFVVKVGTTLRSTQGATVSCTSFGSVCQGAFHTGNSIDTQPPSVSLVYPTDGMKVQQNFLQDLQADASDDAGVSTIEFFDGGNSVDIDASSASSSPKNFSGKGVWDTAGASLGVHILSAQASDLDTNTAKSSGVSVTVRAAHCFNGAQDAGEGETGIDCGGDANSANFCGACGGGTCASNAQCSSGFCTGGSCIERPLIQTVSPLNGMPGTYVTLKGVNFGSGVGAVTFLGAPGAQDDRVALAPQTCVAAGASVWSNTEAIVEVPVGAASGPIHIRNAGNGLADDTNDTNGPVIPNFIADSTQHPGLCSIQPASGFTGSQPSAIGTGFGSSASKVEFGSTELSQAFALWSDSKVTFTVPVVNSAPYPVSIKTASGQSNPVTFTVADKQAGALPELAFLDPVQGPKQGYVTITGKNFGSSVGTVVFTDGNGVQAIGDTSFPASCNAAFWRDNRIVVKVPSAYKNAQNTVDGVYHVKVVRSDLKESGQLDFSINSQLPLLPGICAIEPAVGPVGTVVKILGDQFGTSKPIVTFATNQLGLVTANDPQSVSVTVPATAQTGAVQLKINTQTSNKVNFEVRNCNESANICSANEQCCGSGECAPKGSSCSVKTTTSEFAWQTSTGLIPIAPRVVEECRPDLGAKAPTPSPSPWLGRAGGDAAPTDAPIVMRFNELLDASTVNAAAFHVFACTSASNEPCATKVATTFTVAMTPENASQEVVTLYPSKSLTTSTTYYVTVASSITAAGAGGAAMDVFSSCPAGDKGETYGYCFRFKTRASTDVSTVGVVHVLPMSYTVHETGVIPPSPAYRAEPISASDACIVLNCHSYDWKWSAGDARASVSNNLGADGKGLCEQDVTASQETQQVPVSIAAGLNGSSVNGSGDLFINFLPPLVEDFAPHCNQACLNALIWVRFSGELNQASVTKPGNIVLSKCANENCVESEMTVVPLPPKSVELVAPFGSVGDKPRVITIKPLVNKASILEPGAFYRVLLKGGPNVTDGIRGTNSLPISGLNHPEGYQWIFRVKLANEGALCTADRIDMVPVQKFETNINGRQFFVATPFGKADACSASGQALVPTTETVWASSKPNVAKIYETNGGPVDTGLDLPAGCSGKCLATGSSGQYGKVSVCGNGAIETTDTNYCKNGKTPKGDACVVMPVGAKAGEECEVGMDGDACDVQTCLWRPVALTTNSGTCGNAVVDVVAGEACDYGVTCVGGSNATTTPVAELSSCVSAAAATACAAAGGSCGMHPTRGCSANCRHLGSVAGNSTCGNGDVLGDGKSCDDGNLTNGDGCSSICLHEPSPSTNKVASVCGNGVLEPGETCEAVLVAGTPVFTSGCDQTSCLHTGKIVCGNPNDPNCCGNAKIESGEDCDDANHLSNDGCSSSCLFEGSSVNYSSSVGPAPSFCGNGVIEQGEQCEAGASSDVVAKAIGYDATPNISNVLNKKYGVGDGQVDNKQLAVIVGNDTPDPVTGQMSTEISATLEGKKGTAIYGLQCGYTDESSCLAFGKNLGLDDHGCCSARPKINTPYPTGADVCRNVQIKVVFESAMNISSAVNTIEINQQTKNANDDCPVGTQLVEESPLQPGFFNWVKHLWQTFVAWIKGDTAFAQKWCTGGVTGQLIPVGSPTSTTEFIYQLDHALLPDTDYRVRFLGDNSTTATDPLLDNADLTKRIGIKTLRGVVHPFVSGNSGDLVWTFKTGAKICTANVINIADVTADPAPPAVAHPYLFTNPNNQSESRKFLAEAVAIQNNQAVPLNSVPEYSWKWHYWTASDKGDLVTVTSNPGVNTTADQADVTSKTRSGSTVLTATLEVTNDAYSVPSTTGRVIQGVAPIAVLICERPWPENASPFRDALPNGLNQSSFKTGDPFVNGPFYNFSTMYCLDAGTAHEPADDVPALSINQVKPTTLDADRGILRQYLFAYPPESAATPAQYQGLQKDGIGIRIVANPQHYSPLEWYRSQGFNGQPKAVTVDGFPAVQDGPTLYVAASNRADQSSGPIYSNIYLISHNPDAQDTTLKIYDQMVSYLTFNINITSQSNVCLLSNGTPLSLSGINDGKPIGCSADWECLKLGSNLHCDSLKLKLGRDTQRITDFQAMTQQIESSKNGQGKYPQATGGTFLQNFSTSLWSSWQAELSKEVGGSLPLDPVNHFLTCGHCSADASPCQTAADCPAAGGPAQTCNGGSMVGGMWTANPNIDPQSCWNQNEHQYICPNVGPTSYDVSHVYQYRSLTSGSRWDLASEFEVPPPSNLNDWWSPPLPSAEFRCAATSTLGHICSGADAAGDAQCRSCAGGSCKTCFAGNQKGQSCSTTADCGGNACTDTTPSIVGSCRLYGGTYHYKDICNNIPNGANGICGDGVLNTGETCEVGMTQSISCSNGTGFKQQVCNPADCHSFIDDVQHPQCVAGISCGNGRVDKACGGNPAKACLTNADCTGGVTCQDYEKCDDGALNGSYGHCGVGCMKYSGYCGDSLLSPGELCDKGAQNGAWSPAYVAVPGSCSSDCKAAGPYCGDDSVNGTEECDGHAISTQTAVCTGNVGNVNASCTTDADCGAGGKCGGGALVPGTYDGGVVLHVGDSCVGVTKTVGGFKRETQHTRSCNAPNPNSANACKFQAWTSCQPVGSCGDGILDQGETCDDGTNNGDTKACTNECKQNICGDGKTNQGVEECDNGTQNGSATCTADYNSTCLSCSSLCKFEASAGGYCGNKKKDVGSAEQCDGTDGTANLTCQGLGFDYAKNHKTVTFTGITKDPANPNNPIQCFIASLGSLPEPADTGSLEWGTYEAQGAYVKNNQQYTLPLKAWNSDVMLTDADIDNSIQVGGYRGACKGVTATYGSDVVQCANSCQFTGCGRCSDTPGTGVIEGRIYDAVFQQVVPGARISLLYKGVKVDEAFADSDGHFKISTVNTNAACNGYRVVVDMYEDNPCTAASKGTSNGVSCYKNFTPEYTYPTDIDEGALGGYFPRTSDLFSGANFGSVMNGQDADGSYHVEIYPRPNRAQGYAAVLWTANIATMGKDPFVPTMPGPMWRKLHTVLPEQKGAYTVVDFTANPQPAVAPCTYGTPAGNKPCARDVNYGSIGSLDLSKPPYSRLICLHRTGEKTEGLDVAHSGCPLEGVTQCKANYLAQDSVKLDSTKSSGQKQLDASAACADDATHKVAGKLTCSLEPDWENCFQPAHFGPVTSIVNVANYASTNGKVNFYLIGDPLDGSSLKTDLSSKKFYAEVAYTKVTGESQLLQINGSGPDGPTGTGYWAWHIADIEPKTDSLITVNTMAGTNHDAQDALGDINNGTSNWKKIDGLGVWAYWFQGGGGGAYCVGGSGNLKLDPKQPRCFGQAAGSACTTAGYKCGTWPWGIYNKYNW